MHNELELPEIQKKWQGTIKAYLFGFLSSFLLTSLAFFIVYFDLAKETNLIFILIGLALLQAVIQLIFFLHVGQEAGPKWENLIFFFMLIILITVVLLSFWIMNDLDERMMPNMTHT